MTRTHEVPANSLRHRYPAWAGEDWETCCEHCRKPLFMVAKMEARLPAGANYVERCSGCGRALWYRSLADDAAVFVRALEALGVI